MFVSSCFADIPFVQTSLLCPWCLWFCRRVAGWRPEPPPTPACDNRDYQWYLQHSNKPILTAVDYLSMCMNVYACVWPIDAWSSSDIFGRRSKQTQQQQLGEKGEKKWKERIRKITMNPSFNWESDMKFEPKLSMINLHVITCKARWLLENIREIELLESCGASLISSSSDRAAAFWWPETQIFALTSDAKVISSTWPDAGAALQTLLWLSSDTCACAHEEC